MTETYPRCRDLNLSLESLVCELGDDDISSTQYGSTYIPAGLSDCPDDSLDKVCYPEVHPGCRVFMACVCRSSVDISTAFSPYHTHAVGFYYETYGEISQSRTLCLFLHHSSLLRLISPFQISVRENAYCIVGTARWADLCTSHHIKHMSPSRLPNDAVCI